MMEVGWECQWEEKIAEARPCWDAIQVEAGSSGVCRIPKLNLQCTYRMGQKSCKRGLHGEGSCRVNNTMQQKLALRNRINKDQCEVYARSSSSESVECRSLPEKEEMKQTRVDSGHVRVAGSAAFYRLIKLEPLPDQQGTICTP